MRKIYIYLHVACIGTWKEVIQNMDQKIKESGLYEKVSEIRCSVIGDDRVFLSFINFDPKYKVVFSSKEEQYMANNWVTQSETLKLEDLPEGKLTIDQLYKIDGVWEENINIPTNRPVHNEEIIFSHMVHDSQREDFYALYLHSKGVKRSQTDPHLYANIKDWVNYMLYFNLYHHKDLWSELKDCDVCGVSSKGLYLDGNFWWTKSEHLKTLNPKLGLSYLEPELFIRKKPNTKIITK